MELKEGFKQTEVGHIPENWSIDTLGNVISVLTDFTANGSFASLAQNVKYLDSTDYARLIRLTDIRVNYKNEGVFVSKNSYDFLSKSKLFGNELLLANVGAYTGYSFLYENNLPFRGTLGPNMFLIKFEENKMDSKFAYYCFVNNSILKQLLSRAASSAQPKLNKQNVRECLIFYPPLPEQRSIAIALSNIDELILQTEKLIEKKRNIKQSLIKQLLVGKRRLDDFTGNWIKKPFPQLCWYQEGPGLRNWQFTSDGIKVINVTNLVDGFLNLERTSRYISLNEFDKMYKHFEIDVDDIVVASSGNSYAKVAVVRKQDLPLVMNTSVIRFKPLKDLDYNFLLAFLKSNLFKDQIDLLITGGAQPNFGPFHLNKITIKIPPTKEEQIKISKIINDAELEIQALEKKLSKSKMLKLGMMQALLTGKIRLL